MTATPCASRIARTFPPAHCTARAGPPRLFATNASPPPPPWLVASGVQGGCAVFCDVPMSAFCALCSTPVADAADMHCADSWRTAKGCSRCSSNGGPSSRSQKRSSARRQRQTNVWSVLSPACSREQMPCSVIQHAVICGATLHSITMCCCESERPKTSVTPRAAALPRPNTRST